MTGDVQEYYRVAELVVGLLGGALFVGAAASRFRVPYTIALLLASLPFHVHAADAFVPTVLVVFLPALIFEAAWHMEIVQIRRQWRPIAFLAVPGVAFTALTVAAGLAAAHVMPFVDGLLVGTIVSATDPIAVIAAFKELAAPKELATIVEGESLCNDGISAVLYTAIVAMLTGSQHGNLVLAFQAAEGTFGGVLLGLVVGAIGALTLRIIADDQLQIVTTIVTAFAAYLVAGKLGMSGILAVLVAGVTLRALQGRGENTGATAEIDRFWGVLAFLSNTLVFILLGLRIEFGRIFHEPVLLMVTLFCVVGSRVLLAYAGLPLFGIRDRGWRTIVVLSGMRGALSLALALILPDSLAFRAQIIDAVFGVVAVTLIIQGLAIGPMLQRFQLGRV